MLETKARRGDGEYVRLDEAEGLTLVDVMLFISIL